MRPPIELDDLDRSLVADLAADGRATSAALAAEHGISQTSAAARVRRLIDHRVVRVTVAFDVDRAGFQWQAYCYIKVKGRDINAVAAALAAHPRIWNVAAIVGRYDLMAAFMFVDKADMTRVLTQDVPRIAGIDEMESDVDVGNFVFRAPVYNLLLHDHGPPEIVDANDGIHLPAPIVELDDLDREIIVRLRVDGRRSNRDIGRDLNVSEGTVRQRIKRLQDARLMKIVSWVEPSAVEPPGHVFYIRFVLRGVSAPDMAERLAAFPEITITTAMLGRANLIAMCITPDQRATHTLAHAVRSLPEVVEADLLEIVHVHYMANHFIRIPGPHGPGSARPSQ